MTIALAITGKGTGVSELDFGMDYPFRVSFCLNKKGRLVNAGD